MVQQATRRPEHGIARRTVTGTVMSDLQIAVRRVSVWLAISAACCSLVSCNGTDGENGKKSSGEKHGGDDPKPQTGRDAKPTVDVDAVLGVLPDFELIDQHGQAFGSRELYGKLWIANFIFTRCRATCPQQTDTMAKLQRELATHASRHEIRLIMIACDMARSF